MNVRNILLATAVGGVLAFGLTAIPVDTAIAGTEVKGKVTMIESGGRKVTIGDTKFVISRSRTKVTIGGKVAHRLEIKKGMSCSADIAERKGRKGDKRMEAKWVKC